MKRDLELVRAILLAVEKADAPVPLDAFVNDAYSRQCVAYHIELMEHHGLIDGFVLSDDFGTIHKGQATALTWDGADFLDAIRNERVWKKVTRAIGKSVGTTTLDVVRKVAVEVSTGFIFAELGM